MSETENKEATSIKDIIDSFPSQEELLSEHDGTDISDAPVSSPEAETVADKEEAAKEAKEEIVSEEEGKPSFSEIEVKAIEKGWLPEEEFKGDKAHWVTAREFVDRSNMLDKISAQNREVKELKKSNEDLARLLKKQMTDATQDRANNLIKLKEDAINEGEVEAAYKYEEEYQSAKKEIDTYKRDKKVFDEEVAKPQVPPEVRNFIDRNEWVNGTTPEERAMQEYAISMEQQVDMEYPTWHLSTKLDEVDRRVKLYFGSARNGHQKRPRAPVESKTIVKSTDPKKVVYADLPSEVKAIVNSFCKSDRSRVISKDEYAQHLLDTGAISFE